MDAQRRETEETNRPARDTEVARQQARYQAEQKRIADVNGMQQEVLQQQNKTNCDKNRRDNTCVKTGMSFN